MLKIDVLWAEVFVLRIQSFVKQMICLQAGSWCGHLLDLKNDWTKESHFILSIWNQWQVQQGRFIYWQKGSILGMMAIDDPSEGEFAMFTEALTSGKFVAVDSAFGIG